MSTSNLKSKFLLRIIVEDTYKYLAKLSVFDSFSRILSPNEKSPYSCLFRLNKGLYTIRVEINGIVRDTVITINSDKEYLVSSDYFNNETKNIIEPPHQYSSALLSSDNNKTYSSSHEYYTNPAIDLSKTDTFLYNNNNPNFSNSSLFIFMRFPSKDKYNELRGKWLKPFYLDFEILNEEGDCIINFKSKIGIEVNEDYGWLAFNAQLPNGIYYLIYHGEEPRQIPIYVFKDWHTQFFITLGSTPLFGTTRIFISKQRGFEPKEQTNKHIDILLDKLQNGDYSIDEELIEIAANGKYDSPMLGLICSYVYFKSPNTKNDHLFNIIMQNMRKIILKDNDESPDIRALTILAANHFKTSDYPKTAVKGTPMLRIGFEAIKNASSKDRNLIPQNSINDFISETLFYDSPFNTFKPILYKDSKFTRAIQISDVEDSIFSGESKMVGSKMATESSRSGRSINPKDDKFAVSIQYLLKPSLFNLIKDPDVEFDSENSWVKGSISDLLKSNNHISINEISNKLNLSGNTITRIIETWKKDFNDNE